MEISSLSLVSSGLSLEKLNITCWIWCTEFSFTIHLNGFPQTVTPSCLRSRVSTDTEIQNNVTVLAFLLLCLEICRLLSYFKINSKWVSCWWKGPNGCTTPGEWLFFSTCRTNIAQRRAYASWVEETSPVLALCSLWSLWPVCYRSLVKYSHEGHGERKDESIFPKQISEQCQRYAGRSSTSGTLCSTGHFYRKMCVAFSSSVVAIKAGGKRVWWGGPDNHCTVAAKR